MTKAPEYKCMELTITFLRVLGTWPRWKEAGKLSERLYFCYTGFVLFSMFTYIGILTYGLVFDEKWSAVMIPIERILVFATGSIALVKIIILLMNQRKLEEVIDYINQNLNRRHLLTESDRTEIFYCWKNEQFLIKYYVGSAGLMIVLLLISSMLKLWRESSAGGYERDLLVKYPFVITDRYIFMLSFGHQFMTSTISGEVGTLVDSMFSSLTYYLCGHLRILRDRFKSAGQFVGKDVIEYHKEIIRMVKRVENIFQNFMLLMFMANSFLICLGLLQIIQTNNPNRLSYEKSMLYLSIKLSQLFLYCWYGQEIIKRSEEINFACYSSDWYKYLGKSKFNNFMVIRQHLTKPLRMRARIFFAISIATLKSVMNTAYSFFTMLNSIQK